MNADDSPSLNVLSVFKSIHSEKLRYKIMPYRLMMQNGESFKISKIRYYHRDRKGRGETLIYNLLDLSAPEGREFKQSRKDTDNSFSVLFPQLFEYLITGNSFYITLRKFIQSSSGLFGPGFFNFGIWSGQPLENLGCYLRPLFDRQTTEKP